MLNLKSYKTRFMLLLSVSLLLNACSNEDAPSQDLNLRHPIKIEKSQSQIVMNFTNGVDSLDPEVATAITDFVNESSMTDRRVTYVIYLPIEGSLKNKQSALMLKKFLLSKDVDPANIRIEARAETVDAEDSSNTLETRVTLVSEVYSATGPKCGQFTGEMMPGGLHTPGFGCSYQANLASIVSDPRDFVEMRKVTTSNAFNNQKRLKTLSGYAASDSSTAVVANGQ